MGSSQMSSRIAHSTNRDCGVQVNWTSWNLRVEFVWACIGTQHLGSHRICEFGVLKYGVVPTGSELLFVVLRMVEVTWQYGDALDDD